MIELLGLEIGSIAQVGTFVAVLTGLLTLLIKYRGQTFENNHSQVKQYAETCQRLREEVNGLTTRLINCEKECAKEVSRMERELLGRDRQRINEQISTINVIIDAVGEHPALQKLLKMYESVQIAQTAAVLQSQDGNVIRPENGGA